MTLEELDKEWEESAAFDNTDVDKADCNNCNVFSGAVAEIENSLNQDARGGQ